MSGPTDDDTLIDLTDEESPGGQAERQPGWRPRLRRAPGDERPPRHQRSFGRAVLDGLATARRRTVAGVAASLPNVARLLSALGVVVMAFVLFVTVVGALRHTGRQRHLEDVFRTRVASGHADRPNWRPLPGQAIATISIPSIGVYEVVVEDTTPELLEGGPGHLLGTPLPGQAGNAVILGRRVTGGAPFRNLSELAPDDLIVVVNPSGRFTYAVEEITRTSQTATEPFVPTTDARLTLVTSASWFVPEDRVVVTASLDGTPAPRTVPVALVPQRGEDLGTSGDARAVVPLLPWLAALAVALVAWIPMRSRIQSRWWRFVIAAPVVLVLLYFVFVNAEDLLPGVI
jgi:sortase A